MDSNYLVSSSARALPLAVAAVVLRVVGHSDDEAPLGSLVGSSSEEGGMMLSLLRERCEQHSLCCATPDSRSVSSPSSDSRTSRCLITRDGCEVGCCELQLRVPTGTCSGVCPRACRLEPASVSFSRGRKALPRSAGGRRRGPWSGETELLLQFFLPKTKMDESDICLITGSY